MTAETLRRAAEILRERAADVDDRDDWREYYEGPLVLHPAEGRADADWVALMSPSVGLALADLLQNLQGAQPHDVEWIERNALELARLILGGDS